MRDCEGFILERKLGHGATAEVYSAVRKSDQRRVALKMFHPGLWEQEDVRRRAIAEFRTVSALKHPNIVQVEEPLWDRTPPAVALEYIDGGSLEALQSRLPYVFSEVAAWIVIEVLTALEFAHSQGVIHRDLKPANILIGSEGRVRVSDFGLAKMRDVSQHTLSGTILGSPDYMSPEQARGDVCTPRSDLFSAASVFYFLVTGTPPFNRHSPLATLAAVCDAAPEPVQKRNPKISPELARIIHKGLAKNPNERFGSALEFRQALEEYLTRIGLTLPNFSFSAWLAASPQVTLNALKTISHSLILRTENLTRDGNMSGALETLSHLSLVAPESAAIPRLLGEIETQRIRVRRQRWLAPAIVATLALCAASVLLARHFFKSEGQHEAHAQALPRHEVTASASTPMTALAAEEKNSAPQPEKAPPVILAKKAPHSGLVTMDVPDGIQVFWDSRPVSPQGSFRSKIGNHKVRFEKPGSTPISQTVMVDRLDPTVIRVR